MSKVRKTFVVAIALTCIAANAAAQSAPATKDWEVKVLLYGWASSIYGKASAGDSSTHFDQAFFNDVLDDLAWAVEGNTEVRYQRALLLVDVIGSQLTADADSGQKSFPFQRRELGPGGILTVGPLEASTRLTMWIVDSKLGWRVLSAPFTRLLGRGEADDPRRFEFDLFAGVRYWNVNVDADVDLAPASLTVGGRPVPIPRGVRGPVGIGDQTVPGYLLGGGSLREEQRTDWLDPIWGFRIRADVLESVSLFTLADMGGFGIGEASDLTWQAMGGVEWRFAKHFSVSAAYRALAVNREGVVENLTLYGPQIGLGIRF